MFNGGVRGNFISHKVVAAWNALPWVVMEVDTRVVFKRIWISTGNGVIWILYTQMRSG